MFRASTFDKLLDKATSNLRLEPDWPTILQITDLIRQGDVNPKYALSAIKKKITNQNPHVALFGLLVLESCVKNCGNLIHDEIGTKVYLDQLREIIKSYPHDDVKNKILELIQAWAHAFRNNSKFRLIQDTVNIMKTEGYTFPALKESDAMFSADTAPEWADGDCCHRCRVVFGVVQRKHHCRACGQVFCSQCSSKICTLPKFGIEKEVRVCDPCYDKHTKITTPMPEKKVPRTNETKKKSARTDKPRRSTLTVRRSKSVATNVKGDDVSLDGTSVPVAPATNAPTVNSQSPKSNPATGKSEDELREEEELQLALALSQSEAESVKTSIYNKPTITRAKSYSPPTKVPVDYEKDDPELARYLNRCYWENRQEKQEKMSHITADQNNIAETYQDELVDEDDVNMEEFVSTLRNQVEVFVNRMKSNSSRGRPISTDSSIQTLFLNITAMHSRLLHYIQEQDDQRVYYETLQDKLNQVKDARAALDALREEHKERLRQEAEMVERQRQIQMAQKLQIMRQKKQEYLQFQRQLALQRVHDQELELHMRQEQQKQQYRVGPYNSLPYIPTQGNVSAFEPINSMGGIGPLPTGTLTAGTYMPPQHVQPSSYGHYQQVPQQAGLNMQHSMMPGVRASIPQMGYVPVTLQSSQEPLLSNHMPPPQIPSSQTQPIPGQTMYHQMMSSLKQEYADESVLQQPSQSILPSQHQGNQIPGNVRQFQHSPLSSPSSSSEHSVFRQGPPPVPSAPSASSTPQPVEKEEIAELISFD